MYFLMHGGVISDLTNIFYGPQHANSILLSSALRSIRAIALFSAVAFVIQFIQKKIKKQHAFECVTLFYLGMGAVSLIVQPTLQNAARTAYAVIIGIGTWAVIFGSKQVDIVYKKDYLLFCILGVMFGLVAGFFTSTGGTIMGMGFAFPVAGYMFFQNKSKSGNIFPVLLIGLILLQRTIIIDGQIYTTGFSCNYTIQEGPLAGIRVGEDSYTRYLRAYRVLTDNCNGADIILIANDGIEQMGYCMTDAEMGIGDFEFFKLNDNDCLNYWRLIPDKVPTKIFVFGQSRVDQFLDAKDNDLVAYIEENYSLSEKKTDYLMFEKR